MASLQLQSIRPNITVTHVNDFLIANYSISPKTITELTAFDDRNFHIVSSDERQNEFVFKVTNARDTQNKWNIMEAQCMLLKYLNERSFSCPLVIPDNTGQIISTITCDKTKYATRLFSYIKGDILEKAPRHSNLFYSKVGEHCAKLSKLLMTYPEKNAFKGQNIEWSLEAAPNTMKYINLLENKADREIVQKTFDDFKRNILNQRQNFQQGLIHSDLNCANIIIQQSDNADNNDAEIAGIIDFGEVDWSLLLFDLAILIAHVIEHSGDISSGKYVIEGYLNEQQLSTQDMDVLYLAVKARVYQCLILCIEKETNDPTNLYIREAVRSNLELFRLINSQSEAEILNLWKIKEANF